MNKNKNKNNKLTNKQKTHKICIIFSREFVSSDLNTGDYQSKNEFK